MQVENTPIGEQILGLARLLIRIPSTKERPDALQQVVDVAKSQLTGYSYEEFPGEARDAEGNVASRAPSIVFFNGSERPERFRILLHGHLDVVPPQSESQFVPAERRRRLYGRGAQDMKSGAAALIQVFGDLATTLTYPIGLSLTTDEEIGGFNGAGLQVANGVQADFVISGESTDFAIGNEHKGVIILGVNTVAQGGHTAYDGNSANAVQTMVDFLHEVNRMYPGPTREWRTSSSVTEIGTGNHAHNVVPSEASAQLAFRWVPQDDPESIVGQIQAIDPRIEITRGPFGDAHETKRTHPDVQLLARAVREVTGKKARFDRKAGSSDVRHWTAVGSGGVDFGPVGNGLHTANEYVEMESLEQYAKILSYFLTSCTTNLRGE